MDAKLGNEVTLLPTVLGKGAFGRVMAGVYQGQPVAVKLLLDMSIPGWGLGPEVAAGADAAPRQEAALGRGGGDANADMDRGGPRTMRGQLLGTTEAQLAASLAQEVEVLGRCRHRNVVTLLAACLEPPRYCLVMERCETSLDKLIHGKPGKLLPMREVFTIAQDVASGLEYLHPTIVHRDLKPANVLINHPGSSKLVAKLSDFGLSRLRSTVAPTLTPDAGTVGAVLRVDGITC
ncbi:hypothetical protein GPECTOR_12g608 [Gonium pectorale]|uniref:Protein kinase domain-containing protein n=1 Tax=Gonium pectorale TaxID=33097 RepID=A0A150GPB7_GONPE|nr:hypothetical protein GPECTOR_12g608 [Gonium pectorale]|eukprot:KXZ51644.1 hypothetical protein GPECTOR_12g608 [Gonium pectorale]